MANTFFGLTIGSSGLFASKSGLNTTAHNIANIETKGYSRQNLNQTADRALRTYNSYGELGTGAMVNSIDQSRSKYYDEKFRSNTSIGGLYEERHYFMTEIENYFNEIELEGFTTSFDSMFNALQELSKDPSSLAVRTQVANYSESLCEYFNGLYTNLQGIQNECNYEIKNQVQKINSIADQIAVLTKQINTIEVGGENANDLRDQRNLLVDDLSKIVNVSVHERPIGNGMNTFTVRIDGNTLVDTYDTFKLECRPRKELQNQCDIDGLYDVYWQYDQRLEPTSGTMSGSLKALFEVRDGNNDEDLTGKSGPIAVGQTSISITNTNINHIADLNIPTEGKIIIGNGEYTYKSFSITVDANGVYTYNFELNQPMRKQYTNGTTVSVGSDVDYKGIPYYMSQLSQFIRTFAEEFNTVHRKGQNLDGESGNYFFTGYDVVSGEEYIPGNFNETDETDITTVISDASVLNNSYYMITAKNFKVCKAILDTPAKIATTTDINAGVSGADITRKLLDLKSDVNMFKQGNPAQFLQTLVSEVGIDTTSAKNFSESQANIVAKVTNQRLSVAGVDQDEEAMALARYQEAYNLNSKVISVMNEIYNKLINETGL